MQISNEPGSRGLLGRAILGGLAGAVGVWALDRVTWFMWRREDPAALDRERAARPEGLDPAHKVANTVARAAGRELEPKQPHPLGIAVHYSIGVLPGALYAVLAKRYPALGAGQGVLFGLALFLLQDELLNAVTGLSGKPTAYPWQAHARGLVGHAAYGAAMNASLKAAEQLLTTPARIPQG